MNFKRINWDKLSWIAAIMVGVIMTAEALVLNGGQDIRQHYQPFTQGCLECGFVPYYAQPMLAPMLLTSWKYVWALWVLISVTGLLLVARQTGINPLIFMLSFPMITQFWLGQIDVLLCVGAFLAVKHRSSYLRGLGILMLLVKPQIAFLAVLFLLWREERSQLFKVLVIPAAGFVLSLIVYGFDWPLEWAMNAQTNIPGHTWKLSSEFFWPWSLVLLPLPFLFKDRQDGAVVSFLVSSLVMPFFSMYSYIVFLIFYSSWWVLPLSYAHAVFRPWLGWESRKFAWVLPLTILGVYLTRRFELNKIVAKKFQKTG